MPRSLVPVATARELVLQTARPLGVQRVPVADALDRVLAEDVAAAGDVPPFACSAMDGYAIKGSPAGRTFSVIGEARAGAPSRLALHDGEAVRISTGAAVPEGATAVVRQEDVQARDSTIDVAAPIRDGQHIRGAGEDMRSGTPVLRAGTPIGPAELGAAVAAGAGELVVSARPRVLVLCTGDELRAPGEPLGPGEIHNSNAPMLASLALRAGATVPEQGRLPDDRRATEAALERALGAANVVIISGGVSVGPHDHVKPALEAVGVRELFWGVALQPGKPTWFGERGDRLVFGLPGNPVSAVVTFTLFARPALLALQRSARHQAPRASATLGAAVTRNPDREQALRVRLEHTGAERVAYPNGPQGSHIVTSLLGADALAMIPAGEGELEAGAEVELEPLVF